MNTGVQQVSVEQSRLSHTRSISQYRGIQTNAPHWWDSGLYLTSRLLPVMCNLCENMRLLIILSSPGEQRCDTEMNFFGIIQNVLLEWDIHFLKWQGGRCGRTACSHHAVCGQSIPWRFFEQRYTERDTDFLSASCVSLILLHGWGKFKDSCDALNKSRFQPKGHPSKLVIN